MSSALEGLKVLDFCWVIVGPVTTRFLADNGATVVRVESTAKLDYLRASAPFKDGQPGLNRSLFYNEVNTSKLSLGLNLQQPGARQVLIRLIERWQPDLLTESFGVGAMERRGMDYETVRQVKPDIVYFSSTQFGQNGPNAGYSGFGNVGAAVSGLNEITGWPNGEPVGAWGALPDMTNPPLAITAILAALDYRRRTGKGQQIDLAQSEGFLQFLAPAFLDLEANDRVATRQGNRDEVMCPHAVFPCAGDDRWIAIAVASDEDWHALSEVIAEDWVHDARFKSMTARKEHESEIEDLLARWTRGEDAFDLTRELQAVGIAAGVVNKPDDLIRDPQLCETFFETLDHPELGPILHAGQTFSMSETRAEMRRPPLLGEHNLEVLCGLAGYSEEEVIEMMAAGIIENP